MSHLSFIIPIRHPANASNWDMTCRFLESTAQSIAAQKVSGWRAIVVVNEEAELPSLPKGFSVCRVNFPPNQRHDIVQHGKSTARDAVRLDKGRRILAGMLAATDSSYFMVVDDDDFISSQISGFVLDNVGAPGWHVDTGFGWSEDSSYCVRMSGFSGFCGSSLIVRSDLYNLPPSLEAADPEYVKDWLGSHVRVKGFLKAAGTPLTALPFDGAIYRIGHSNSHSHTSALWQYFFLHPKYVFRPRRLLANLKGLRRVTPDFKQAFFGQDTSG